MAALQDLLERIASRAHVRGPRFVKEDCASGRMTPLRRSRETAAIEADARAKLE
jgi:hypothetical protein